MKLKNKLAKANLLLKKIGNDPTKQKAIKEIGLAYDKIVKDYYSELSSHFYQLSKSMRNFGTDRAKKADSLFHKLWKNQNDNKAMYTILNSVFGPNEIRNPSHQYGLNIKGHGKKLDDLDKKFKGIMNF